jgi:hypothetical protein
MRAKYLGAGAGQWKGVDLTPFCTFTVPDHLTGIVANNPNFEVIPDGDKARPDGDGVSSVRRRGRGRANDGGSGGNR